MGLTDEQREQLAKAMHETVPQADDWTWMTKQHKEKMCRAADAAYEAVVPLVLAEAAKAFVDAGWVTKSEAQQVIAKLTAKPDPRVEAVKAILKGTMSTQDCDRAYCEEQAAAILAALDKLAADKGAA